MSMPPPLSSGVSIYAVFSTNNHSYSGVWTKVFLSSLNCNRFFERHHRVGLFDLSSFWLSGEQSRK